MSDRILIFENPGEIDPRLITTLGVNVKAGDNSPIGFFGTGLKYAIAVALREKCELRVQSGLREFRFATIKDVIRGKEFEFIEMIELPPVGDVNFPMSSSYRLGFTTELGKTWQPWMAYRELRSNCLDETGLWRLSSEWPEPLAGWSRFALRGEALVREHDRAGEFFLQTAPIAKIEGLDIHPGASKAVFYRGVKVATLTKHSAFTYNITEELTLTEDRTADQWDVRWKIMRSCAHHLTSESLLRAMLVPEAQSFESTWDWTSCWQDPTPQIIEILEEARAEKAAKITPSALEWCKGKISRETLPSTALTRVETAMLRKARDFLAKLGHEVTEKINIVESLGNQSTMGLAEGGEIFLPKALFGKGTKYLASTLLEEHLHCKHGFADGSRELQDWLFDRVVSLGEELQGEPL